MLKAHPKGSKLDLSSSLTQNVSSYLACGPLKLPEVLGSLLGRPVTPNSKAVYVRGYELVTVLPNRSSMPKRRNPIFLPNPADFSVASFALYNDLTQHELRIIAHYNGIGEITEASLETSEFENHSLRHLIHRLREGARFSQYYFPTEDEIYDEYEMEHLPFGDYAEEAADFKKRFERQQHRAEGAILPPRSRR